LWGGILKEKLLTNDGILITGINGFLGSNLAKLLIRNGYNVIGTIRNKSNLEKIKNFKDKVKLINIDIGLEELKLQNISYIVHTATNYDDNSNIEEVAASNLIFPLRLLNLILTDTQLVFINCSTKLPRNLNCYSLSKYQFEEWLVCLAQKYNNLKIINCQIEQFYGYKDNRFTQNIFDSFLNNLKSIELTSGEQIRDFIYIDDLTSVLLLLINKHQIYTQNFINIQIGNGVGYKIKDVILLIQKICNSYNTELLFGAKPYRINEPMSSIADVEQLNKIGWKPKYNLETGLKYCYEGYKS
jgi:CDP-paratose synthetase